MKHQIVTRGIVLARTDFQEADRIITILTADAGKARVMAKGVRRQNSKLAGGIELFSVSEVTLLPTRGELQTLVSSRLVTHYGSIVKDIKRTMLGYDFLKRINRVTEDAVDREYFDLLQSTLAGLDDSGLQAELLELWFLMQLLSITGHAPNMRTDTEGRVLDADETYIFDFDEMGFRQQNGGPYNANHIKVLRLAYAADDPLILKQIKNAETTTASVLKLASHMAQLSIRL